MPQITNATKGILLGLVTAVLNLLTAFNVLMTQAQIGAITTVVSLALTLWIALTYKNSRKRIPNS